MCLPDQAKGSTIQAIAVLVGNILSLNFGLTFGTTPAHSKLYESDNTPLNHPISNEESTWISGYLFLSVALGSLVFGLITPKIGPKSVLLLAGLLQITGWFSIHFGFDILHIYSSRIFAGIAAGAAFTVMPIYISEISETPNKAALTVSVECSRALGIVIGFALGSYLRYDYVSIVGICISIVFTMTFPFIQESPFYYIRKGNEASFEKSLRWFRGIRSIDDRDDPVFLQEVRQIKNRFQSKSQIAEPEMSKSYLSKLIVYGIILSVGAQLSGVYVIFNYGSEIFGTASHKFSMEINIIILAVVQFVGTLLSKWIIVSLNRKVSLFVTSFISALCLVTTTLYLTYGSQWQLEENLKSWLLLLLLSAHMLFTNIGIFSLTSTVLMEILPSKLQTRLLSFLQFISWLITFFIIQYFTLIVNLTSLFWLFTIGSLCVTVFSGFFFDNTRGISSEEIQQKMGYSSNGHIAQLSPTNGYFKKENDNYI